MKILHELSKRVEFVDTDAAGLVHFSNYFRWMASCEESFFNSLHIPLLEKDSHIRRGWPRIHSQCSFSSPLAFNDSFSIQLSISSLTQKFIEYNFLFKKTTATQSLTVAQGSMKTVYVQMDLLSSNMHAILISDSIYNKIKSIID